MKAEIVGKPSKSKLATGWDIDVALDHGVILEFTVEPDGEVRFWTLNVDGCRYVGEEAHGTRIEEGALTKFVRDKTEFGGR